MRDKEVIRAQFAAFAVGATTAQDISNALANLERAEGLKIADFITVFCRENGIDPQAPEVEAYYNESKEYKDKIQADANKKRAENASKVAEEKLRAYQDNLSRNVSPDTKAMIELAAEINKEAGILGAGKTELARLGSFADYRRECIDFDPDRDFAPLLFDKLAFPNGTVSYIGARTGRGKTTAMVNLAREAITQVKPRRTLFISLEMSRKQILNKLVLSTAYAYAISTDETDETDKTDKEKKAMKAPTRPQTDLYHFLKGQGIEGEEAQVAIFRRNIAKALKTVEDAYNDTTLLVYDGRGAAFGEIISAIKGNADPGTLVLLDYIQRMPDAPNSQNDSYMRVKRISDVIVNTAVATNSLVISGAQFKREGKSSGGDDQFDDASYRESGDLEQDAHNAIGIGWKADKLTRFFEVLKTREDAGAGKVFFIDFVGAYSYMGIGEKRTSTPSDTKGKDAPAKEDKKPVEEPQKQEINPYTGLPYYKGAKK
jgi:hypothetical protein